MSRKFPLSTLQVNSYLLRNKICPLGTPEHMAEVSSHLRNFAVAEAIGFIGLLDGHPGIAGKPEVRKGPAAFQQTQGTVANPLAHAIPADMLLNGDNLINFYQSPEAQDALERVFGMGVIAPEDWETQSAFPHQPRQHNIVDSIAERHRHGGGLVEAFQASAEAAVGKGAWDGSGQRRHDLASLTRFIADIYGTTWVPLARSAYTAARLHFTTQLQEPRNASPERQTLLQHRRKILEIQFGVFNRETSASPEAAQNVWKFTAAEKPWA